MAVAANYGALAGEPIPPVPEVSERSSRQFKIAEATKSIIAGGLCIAGAAANIPPLTVMGGSLAVGAGCTKLCQQTPCFQRALEAERGREREGRRVALGVQHTVGVLKTFGLGLSSTLAGVGIGNLYLISTGFGLLLDGWVDAGTGFAKPCMAHLAQPRMRVQHQALPAAPVREVFPQQVEGEPGAAEQRPEGAPAPEGIFQGEPSRFLLSQVEGVPEDQVMS